MTELDEKLPKDSLTRNVFENVKLTIVDFGFATKYVHSTTDSNGDKQVVHR